MKRILVFSPHPDDDLIGCGGSLIKHAKASNEVSIVYMTSGDAGSRTIDKMTLGKTREDEATKAANSIGIKDLTFLRNPDGYLSDTQENFITVTDIIRDKRPNIIYVPHALDGHADHQATNKIVIKAVGSAAGPWFQETKGEPWVVPSILAYEVWTPLQNPSYIEETTDEIDQQIKALMMHESQVADVAYDELVKGLHAYRGFMLGRGKYAEAFSVIQLPSSSIGS
jgi:LmbE family N-acetylglucosaminyl deacetylase